MLYGPATQTLALFGVTGAEWADFRKAPQLLPLSPVSVKTSFVLRSLKLIATGCQPSSSERHFSETRSRSANCASEGRSQVFSGSTQLRSIGLRQPADVAVLEGAATGPFNDFGDSALLTRGDTARCSQELIANLVERGTPRSLEGCQAPRSRTRSCLHDPQGQRSPPPTHYGVA
jgi:hypothetical protein